MQKEPMTSAEMTFHAKVSKAAWDLGIDILLAATEIRQTSKFYKNGSIVGYLHNIYRVKEK